LIGIADGMPAVAERRRAIAGAWYERVLDLAQAPALETPDGERILDRLLAQLRRAWMATAHEHADVTFRSPLADVRKMLPSRTTIAYAYERSLENNPLEERLPAYRPVPAGWSARHLLFCSGMAALSGIMQSLPGIDSTLVGPTLPLARILDEAPALPLVLHASSGLKLDQAGFELANVGIVSLYAPATRGAELDATADRLRMIRRLDGTALTIDTVALLDIPFFLDAAAFYEYCTAVFAHNAALARAVPAGGLFANVAHPALDPRDLPWAQAPFVFFHLRDDDPARYAELEAFVVAAAAARGPALERGGSFGFRGHRCEAIALNDGPRRGVFKVALGERAGPSAAGIVALLVEIAGFPTVEAAREALERRR
jgi:hypothetical protein